MSYSAVHFMKRTSRMHHWYYDQNGTKQHELVEAPLHFFIGSRNGKYKTIYDTPAKKVNCRTWGEYKEKVESYKQMNKSLYESDLSVDTKFLVEKYAGDEMSIPNFDIHFVDIEVHSEEGFPDAENANYPVVIITVWSTKHEKFFIFAEKDFDDTFLTESGEAFEKIIECNEDELLKKYIRWTHDEHPDIITGWNSNGYDIPYLVNRAKNLLGDTWAKRFSPIGKVEERQERITEKKTEQRYVIAGISLLDYLEIYKNYTFQERENYKLGFITKTELGEEVTKKEYEGSIAQFYNDDWQGYVEYNIQDVRLLKLLEDKLGYIGLLVKFCYGCHVPFEQYRKTTRVLDGAFISELSLEGIVMPDVDRDKRNCSYPGGFVAEPDRGIHDWVVSFDATSLYPSIMMGWNISPETKVGVINNNAVQNIYNCYMGKNFDRNQKFEFDGKKWEVAEFCEYVKEDIGIKVVNEKGGFHNIANSAAVKKIMNGLAGKPYDNETVYLDDEEMTIKSIIKLIKDKNYCLSGNGVLYRQDETGVIPRFVQEWFNRRNRYKNQQLEAEKESKKHEKLDHVEEMNKWNEKAKYYELLQHNYKILINSVYGYLGTVYSRFYDFDNCVAVTITGQFVTRTVKNTLDGYFENKWPSTKLGNKFKADPIKDIVIYGDTDSVYVDFSKILKSIHYPLNKKGLEAIKNFIIYSKEYKNEELFGSGEDEEGNQIGGMTKDKREKLEAECPSIQNYVSKIIDCAMTKLTLDKFHCAINKISFKREAVASTGCFLMRKRYVLHVLNNEGVEQDKLKSTGVDLVRSSTPILVQKALKKIILDILLKRNESHSEEQLREFREKFINAKPEDVARPTSVNGLDDYTVRMDNNDFKGVPIHVKSSYYYNQMMNKYPKIATTYEYIHDGDKMKWIYTKNGAEWNYDTIGFKDRLPHEFGLDNHIDYELQFEKTFENAIKPFYEVMDWNIPNLKTKKISQLFEW